MRSFSPVHIRHLVESRLFGSASFKDICDEHIIVADGEPYDDGPSVYLPHQLENVTSLGPETFQEAEDERVKGGRGKHGPVEAFRISGVKYCDSGLYKRNWRFYFPQVKPGGVPVRASGRKYALASSYSGIQYFGHWLRDDSTTYLVAKEFAEPFCVRTPDWPHKEGYTDYLNIPWPMIDAGDLEEIYFFLDFSQNAHKVARYREMRRRIRSRFQPKFGGHRVYLKRGATGAIKRLISNEAEVIAALEGEGFHILDIEKDPLETIIETLLDARIFVSIEGSHADHALFTIANEAGFLAINPPHMFNNPPKDWTSALGMKYGFVVGETDGVAFKVNVRDLLKTVEMLEAVI